MSKRGTECVIQGGELSAGKQLALDSMKASAIHFVHSLLDRSRIRSIIAESGCRRGAKHSQSYCDCHSCQFFLSAPFMSSVCVMISAWKWRSAKGNGEWQNRLMQFFESFLICSESWFYRNMSKKENRFEGKGGENIYIFQNF
ncbi:hypothetical protein XENORESO_006773 [Xenotaenia resolanae]|uniref:Uncharacterized protein n=1 Tax=Xenotaenia resolanae TaxID=208358 RepID=A0ABV0VWT6_9TELE